jgi:membrane fusion protein (multidrug efflux system)
MKRCFFLLAASFCTIGAVASSLILPVAEVTERADKHVSTFPGRVVPISEVYVVPQVSGEILEVCFENGAMVKEGDVLYRLDPVKYEAAVKNAESKVAECKANASYAELSYARHKKLLETRAVSVDAVDNALSLRDSSRAAYAAAKADLISAKDDLQHCTIVAPISGKIGSTTMTRGNYAKAAGEPLVSIVQVSPIRVRFSISNSRFLRLFGGLSRRLRDEAIASVTLANGNAFTGQGAFDYVENKADELTDTLQVFFQYANTDGLLRPGGTVTVTLASKTGEWRPAVPPSAILQDIQGPYVWVLDAAGTAVRRSIARGDLVGDWVFVEKGLKKGERIVADGAHKVKRGMTIEAAK